MAERRLSWVLVGNLILEADDPHLMRWEGDNLLGSALINKAKALLFEFLTPEQRQTADDYGWFIVKGPVTGKEYAIWLDGPVYELGPAPAMESPLSRRQNHGLPGSRRFAKHWCIVAPGFPKPDAALAKMALILSDEAKFLSIAL